MGRALSRSLRVSAGRYQIPPSRPLAVPAAFYGNAGTGKTKAVFTDEDTEEEILDTALADDTTVTISPVRTNSISEIMTEAITG